MVGFATHTYNVTVNGREYWAELDAHCGAVSVGCRVGQHGERLIFHAHHPCPRTLGAIGYEAINAASWMHRSQGGLA
jgi:hypothetical protein